jgi:tetratricopeptide (TPR) repeat protein
VWHAAIDDEDVGPVTLLELGRFVELGKLDRDALVWRAGMDDWLPAGEVKQVCILFDQGKPDAGRRTETKRGAEAAGSIENAPSIRSLANALRSEPISIEALQRFASVLENKSRAIEAGEGLFDVASVGENDEDWLSVVAEIADVLERAVRVDGRREVCVFVAYILGVIWSRELDNAAKAIGFFNAVLDLEPTHAGAILSMEQYFARINAWDALKENYVAMLRRLPEDAPGNLRVAIWRKLGDLFRFELDDLESATQAFRVIAKIRPDDLEVLEVLAELLSRNPNTIDDAISAWQGLVQLNPDKLARPLHELVRLYVSRKLNDRAYLACLALKTLNDASPDELRLMQGFTKQTPPQAKRIMTDKLWDALLLHPSARGPLAQLSLMLWQTAGPALVRQSQDYGLDQRKVWEKEDLDAAVPRHFVTQFKYVRAVLNVGGIELWNKLDGAEALGPLSLETPTLAIGARNPLLREPNARSMWFQIARQVTALRPAFILPRALGSARFQALVDVAIRLVEPSYPVASDPREVAEVERLLARISALLANALQPTVAELLNVRQTVTTRTFLEGIELTSLRAGLVLAADLEVALAAAQQYESGMLVSVEKMSQEILLYALSEHYFELRQRLECAIP